MSSRATRTRAETEKEATRPAKLQLHADQEHAFTQLVQGILQQHLTKYSGFRAANANARASSLVKWKSVKTRDGLTVYRKLGREERATTSAATDRSSAASGSPKLALMGTIAGTLEDALYGAIAPNTHSMKIRTAYLEDEFVDWKELAQIQGPGEQNPFQYLGVKWQVKTAPRAAVIMRAREFYWLESTGIHVADDGERLGYHIVHSIDLPEYEGARQARANVVRAKISACYLFKQLPSNTVDVYARSWFDAGGHVMDKLATMRASHSFISIWKWMWCAHNKKLTWMVKEATRARPKKFIKAHSTRDDDDTCAICSKKMALFRSLEMCVLCQRSVCGKCQVRRTLHDVHRTGEAIVLSVHFCVACITQSAATSTTEVMIQQYCSHGASTSSSAASSSVASIESSSESPRTRVTRSLTHPTLRDDVLAISTVSSGTVSSHGSAERVPVVKREPSAGLINREYATPHPSARDDSQVPAGQFEDQSPEMRMWMQMQQLQITAEQTYQQAKQNASMYMHTTDDKQRQPPRSRDYYRQP